MKRTWQRSSLSESSDDGHQLSSEEYSDSEDGTSGKIGGNSSSSCLSEGCTVTDSDSDTREGVSKSPDINLVEEASSASCNEADLLDLKPNVGVNFHKPGIFSQHFVPAYLSGTDFVSMHPGKVVETLSMNNVGIPPPKFDLKIGEKMKRNALSNLQCEAILLACEKHKEVIAGVRQGFLIGDGPGVGKGRILAGIIWENFLRNRQTSVWISVSPDLEIYARNDLEEIGADIPLKVIKTDRTWDRGGVLFCTYSSLVSCVSGIVDFLGSAFDGVIGLDECHRAKNLQPEDWRTKDASMFGISVEKLQTLLPMARIVYMSATGASEPRHLAYMARLGLWGVGAYCSTKEEFIEKMSQRGISAMELLALDLKRKGYYVARQLSLDGITCTIEDIFLSPSFVSTYDVAVSIWDMLMLTARSLKSKKVMTRFWGGHLCFFRHMCMAAKVQKTISIAREALEAGNCVVIGLQTTGEASVDQRMKDGVDKALIDGFTSPARVILDSMIEMLYGQHPSKSWKSSHASEIWGELETLRAALPKNCLDELLAGLGGPDSVAELTGRRGRVVKRGNNYVHESRGDIVRTNRNERDAFMGGKKLVAIISDASSTGVSLHSDKRVDNKRQRLHITLELPWSADKVIQQLGRSHRSNEAVVPRYIMLVCALGGERRFASAVATRLEHLGAITRGDRRATSLYDKLGSMSFENEYGRMALKTLLRVVCGKEAVKIRPPAGYNDFNRICREALQHVGVIRTNHLYDCEVKTFLNRLLGIKVDLQNDIFSYFLKIHTAFTNVARRNGILDLGLLDLRAQHLTIEDEETYLLAEAVSVHKVIADRGLGWGDAHEMYRERLKHESDGFYKAVSQHGQSFFMVLYKGNGQFAAFYPSIGEYPALLSSLDLARFHRVPVKEAEMEWDLCYISSTDQCHHMKMLGYCKESTARGGCDMGRRICTMFLLTGGILRAWSLLEETLPVMQLVRANDTPRKCLLGLVVQTKSISQVRAVLKSAEARQTSNT